MAILSRQERNGLRLIAALKVCAEPVLYTIFRWGTKHQDLEEYSTSEECKYKFNKTEKDSISESPDGSQFDTTLLFPFFKLVCKNVAPFNSDKWTKESTEMEYYIYAVKEMRNDICHSKLAITKDDLLKKTEKLRQLLIDCLKTSGERFEKGEAVLDQINQMNVNLDNIVDENLGEEDIIKLCPDVILELILRDRENKVKLEVNGLRLLKAVIDCGRSVLHTIFLWGTPDKPLDMRLDQYLAYKNITKNTKYLPRSYRGLINESSDASKFDISLLYQCIKLACEHVAPYSDSKWVIESLEMEYYITAIKNMRNEVVHIFVEYTDEEFVKKTDKLREMLTGALKTSGERYERDQEEVEREIRKISDDLDYINKFLGEENIMKYNPDEIKQLMSDSNVTLEELNGLILYKAVAVAVRSVLYTIFLWGTPDKPLDMKLSDYLMPKMGENNIKFNQEQITMVNESPDGFKFDVPLLYESIKLACADVASYSDRKWSTKSSEMEYYISAIKDIENDAINKFRKYTEEGFVMNTEELRELLTGALTTSGQRYKKDQDEVEKELRKMNENLDHILYEFLGNKVMIKDCSDDTKKIIIMDSSNRLKEIFENISYISSLFFTNDDLKIKVDKIFVDIEFKQGKHGEKGEHLDYRNLLQLVQTKASSSTSFPSQHSTSTPPQVLLLEGVAGSGKTTLVKLVLHEWIQGGRCVINGIDNYKLLLWVQCNDSTMTSYWDVLERLMPDIAVKFWNYLPEMLKLCKILIIIDGLDEDNVNSRCLVDSLLQEFKSFTNVTFLCTSRPEKVENFSKRIPREYDVKYATVQGISKPNIPKFVRVNHQEIIKHTGKNRRTEALVNKVTMYQGVSEHLKLPVNLIFMIYMWDSGTYMADIMSVSNTKLVHGIHELCKEKLLEKLRHHETTMNMDDGELKEKVEQILTDIYKTSLENVSSDQLNIEVKHVSTLISACKKLGLPHKEVLSVFFSLQPAWEWLVIKERYSLPHKVIQDHYGAQYIVRSLSNGLLCSTTVSIREVLQQVTGSAVENMNKYNNVLVQVAELLSFPLDQLPGNIAKELVDLLHESGMRDSGHWLDLLANANLSLEIITEISRFFTAKTISISDHHVSGYSSLLPHLRPIKVDIVINGDPGDLPRLPDLLSTLGQHHHTSLVLKQHYQSETPTTSDHLLTHLLPGSDLQEFQGCLTAAGVTCLPGSVRYLSLAVLRDLQPLNLISHLHTAVTSTLQQLYSLSVRVPAGVPPTVLKALPSTPRVELVLSDVSDAAVTDMCRVTQELQPQEGYTKISCINSCVTHLGIEELISALGHHDVMVKGRLMVLTSVTIPQHQQHQLVTKARTTLKCDLDIICSTA